MINKAKAYEMVSVEAKCLALDSYEWGALLLSGALKKCTLAKNAMERKNIHDKGVGIGAAISILDGLQASLDREGGGKLAVHLSDLCFYMMHRLLEANYLNDSSKIEEVMSILKPLQTAWIEAKNEQPR